MIIKAAAVTILLACLAANPSQLRAQEVLFAPQSPGHTMQGQTDWQQIFQPGAPWSTAAAHIAVLGWSSEHAAEWPLVKLSAEYAYIKNHGMKLAITVMPLPSTAICGFHVEGYVPPGHAADVVARLKEAGITPDYLGMDGTLFHGHYLTGPATCQSSVATVAAQAAATLNTYLAAFPNATVADSEPAPIFDLHPTFEADFLAFKSGLEKAIGRRLMYLVFDVSWTNPAIESELAPLAAFVRKNHMGFGVIYDGDPNARSGLAWNATAEQYMTMAESRLGIIPDQAVIATWNPYPTHIMPDTDPSALSYLVPWYFRSRTRLTLRRHGNDLVGQLVDQTQSPVAGVLVSVSQLGADMAHKLQLRVISDRVPPNARFAILGWRVNSDCNCAGVNDLLVGDLLYREEGGGDVTAQLSLPAQIAATRGNRNDGIVTAYLILGGEPAVHLQVAADQHFQDNSAMFAVTPGATFTLSAPLGSVDGNGMFGSGVIIFLDVNGAGIGRSRVGAADTTETKAIVHTDAQGMFIVPEGLVVTSSAPVRLRVSFPGSIRLRPAEADMIYEATK